MDPHARLYSRHTGALADLAVDGHETIVTGAHTAKKPTRLTLQSAREAVLPTCLDRRSNRHTMLGMKRTAIDEEFNGGLCC